MNENEMREVLKECEDLLMDISGSRRSLRGHPVFGKIREALDGEQPEQDSDRKFPNDRAALLAIQGLLTRRRPDKNYLDPTHKKPFGSGLDRYSVPLQEPGFERAPVYRGDWTMTTEWKLDPTRKPGRYVQGDSVMDYTEEALVERAIHFLGYKPSERPEDLLFI